MLAAFLDTFLKYLFLIRLSCPCTARDVLHGIFFVKERKAILGRIPSIFSPPGKRLSLSVAIENT